MAVLTGFTFRNKGKEMSSAATYSQAGKSFSAFAPGGNLFVGSSGAAGVGNGNDTTLDTLFSYSLLANALDKVGRGVYVYASGTFANNVHAKTATLSFGGSISLSSTSSAGGSVIPWALELLLFKAAANVQVASGQVVTGTTHGGCLNLPGTEADTAAITIAIKGQTGTAAANDVVCNLFQVSFMN